MYFATPAGQNMWSEQHGTGAAVFAYILFIADLHANTICVDDLKNCFCSQV